MTGMSIRAPIGKRGKRQGVDRGEASKSTYLMNMTIGHHGLFSITPVWALLPVGWILGLAVGRGSERWFHIAVLTASTVCFLFYLNRPLIDRNYGGVSACFRWLLWFAPLWLVTIAPVFDRLGRLKLGRVTALLLLAFSLFSVATALKPHGNRLGSIASGFFWAGLRCKTAAKLC